MSQRPDARSSLSVGRRCLLASSAIISATLLSGCMQGLLALGYIIGGPPSIEPDFEKQTKQSLTDRGVTVAVLCYAPKELKWDFEAVDKDIARQLSYKLSRKKVKVISPDSVQDWLDKNPDWDTAAEIGAKFKTTYVVDIELQDYDLFEKGSQTLYRGQAVVSVKVWKMDDNGDGKHIYSTVIRPQFPLGGPRPATEISYSNFRRAYLKFLSEQIGYLFYEHYNGDNMMHVL